jgi:hypothetical protein
MLLRALAAFALLLPLAGPAASAEPWETTLAASLGRTGTEMPGGVYRIGLPRTDLHVELDGVALKPGFALGGWLAFARHGGNDVTVMGDLVLTDEEVAPVMRRLLRGGLEVTALHNHLLRASPHTMYMHVGGHGDAAAVGATIREALAASHIPPPAAAPPAAAATPPPLGIDVAAVEHALGRPGKNNGGILAFAFPRAQPPRMEGMAIPDAMGAATAVNFQPTHDGRAAITGDFVLTADEVEPVMRTLSAHGIEVTALHNHMIDEQPRLFFMHFWAEDEARRLAAGLADALSHVAVARP